MASFLVCACVKKPKPETSVGLEDDLYVDANKGNEGYIEPNSDELKARTERFRHAFASSLDGNDDDFVKSNSWKSRSRRGGQDARDSQDSNRPASRRQLMRTARSAIGTPYVSGGTSLNGFDCSGFVCWAYRSVGVKLPRTAREQSCVGQKVGRIENLREGDIVTFHHPRRGYHTGIYVGDGKFIHSPRRHTTVRVNSLTDPYFCSTFTGARRVSMAGNENLVAQAKERLGDDDEFFQPRRGREALYRGRGVSSRDRRGRNAWRDRDSAVSSRDRKGRNARSDRDSAVSSRDRKSGYRRARNDERHRGRDRHVSFADNSRRQRSTADARDDRSKSRREKVQVDSRRDQRRDKAERNDRSRSDRDARASKDSRRSDKQNAGKDRNRNQAGKDKSSNGKSGKRDNSKKNDKKSR
ncbi:MAG: C40 family peptidase [Desulfovibrio sp.]|nr:C40 family peptidase [Desulfovibrio sp.]